VSGCCRVPRVSTSGFYSWQADPVREKDLEDAYLCDTIVDIWTMSRRSYGSPRVHAELRLGQDMRWRKRVERLMRQAGIAGMQRRKRRGCTKGDPSLESSDDLVERAFDPTEPDRLWVMDVTEHPTQNGKASLGIVLDAFSRRVVGWSIADHMRSELVVDALQMAIWRRRPPRGHTIAHSDHGSTSTSWAFGRRRRGAGLFGSMGSIGERFDHSVAESFFGTIELELLDEHHWASRQQLAQASSSGSRPGTTRVGATATAKCSVPWTMKPHTRHDQQPTATVRWSGGSSPRTCSRADLRARTSLPVDLGRPRNLAVRALSVRPHQKIPSLTQC
jgi:putative transposase